jgi:hypothetical protein
MEDETQDRCPVCWRTGFGQRWSLLSRHPSSQGEVEYLRCDCGCVVVAVDGEVVVRRPAAYAGGSP